jgi:hypothetical protein
VNQELSAIPEDLGRTMAEVGLVLGQNTRGHINLMIERFSVILRDGANEHA